MNNNNDKISDLKKKIKGKEAIYDHAVDQKTNKWNSKTILNKIELNKMPDYLKENYKKYTNWLEV